MKLTITRQNLHNGLGAVSASIPTRSALPVLSNVLLETSDDALWISGTDLDVWIRIKVAAQIVEGGSITIPGKKLQELTRELPDEPVDLHIRGHQVEIDCGYSRIKLNGLPSEEFPNLPEIEFEEGWKVGERSVVTLINTTSFAVSNEESRPTLNGVFWEIDDTRMSMVATNGHRLARMAAQVDPTGGGKAKLVVPPAALAQVARLFDGNGELTVARGGNHLGFCSDTKEVYTRLIDGKYPEYEQVIPKDNDKSALVDRSALAAAVRRIKVVTSPSTGRVKLSLENDRVLLDAMSPDLGEAHDEVELEYEGDGLQIGFNATYLLEVLSRMPAGEVKMSFKSAERAATLEPADGDLEYLCLIMPLRLAD